MSSMRNWGDDTFVNLVRQYGNMSAAARAKGQNERSFRREVERRGLQEQCAVFRAGRSITDEQILDEVAKLGSLRAACRSLGLSYTTANDRLTKHGLIDEAKNRAGHTKQHQAEQAGVSYLDDGNTVEMVTPSFERVDVELGDVAEMIRERGLDPDDWVVAGVRINEWDAMAAVERGDEPRIVKMRQLKVTLRRAPHLLIVMPPTDVPRIPRKPGRPMHDRARSVLVIGDHQAPFHNPELHHASLNLIEVLDSARHSVLSDVVHLGDLMDLPTISRHADHPSTMSADVNLCVQSGYEIVRDLRDAARRSRIRFLLGNHDWRLQSELLLRSERMYGVKPASTKKNPDPLPALSLVNLLELDALDIELIEDPRGWQHAEVEIVPGRHGMKIRHGWLTGANTAAKTLAKLGRSAIVGHIHKPESFYMYDPSAGVRREAHTLATMSHSRDRSYPNYVVEDMWLQGCGVLTVWGDETFNFAHVPWIDEHLVYRDHQICA